MLACYVHTVLFTTTHAKLVSRFRKHNCPQRSITDNLMQTSAPFCSSYGYSIHFYADLYSYILKHTDTLSSIIRTQIYAFESPLDPL